MIIKTSATINKPSDVVWNIFTDPKTWETWYGGKLSKVNPDWQKGAQLEWALGSPSTVIDFVAGNKISTKGGNGLIMNYLFSKTNEMATTVTFEKDFSQSTLSVSNSSAVKSQLDEELTGLKKYAESQRGYDANDKQETANPVEQLMTASKTGNLAQVSKLIKDGVSVNVKAAMDETPLMGACRAGSIEVVKALVEGGARINDTNVFGLSPLLLATANGKIDVVKYLIEKRANINAKDNDHGDTALMWAIDEGHSSIALLLIDSGADVNATNKHKQTAFDRAKTKQQNEVLNALEKSKSGTTAPSTNNRVPLQSVAVSKKWWQFWK